MEIEQVIKISQLYDFYSELLSDKQRQYLDDYYFNDLSLTEISENKLYLIILREQYWN